MATALSASRASLSSVLRSPAAISSARGSHSEHRGLSFWMHRVLEELANVRSSPDSDAVHDLRVAIRRCRSLASVMEEVDPDPAWPEMRKVARKLFRGLGALRDAQVMIEWVKKLGSELDPLRARLVSTLEAEEKDSRANALRIVGKFDEKDWKRLERHLRQRARLVPAGSLAAECLALERHERARDLHARALRTAKAKPWHASRIGLKRFRYTVEGLLPERYALWGENLKRLQDLLGDIHDLDVLAGLVKDSLSTESSESPEVWLEKVARERKQRIEIYRHLTLGKTSLWNEWRHGLPRGERLEAAVMARLRATARAADPNPRRTAKISRIALAIFDAFRRAHAAPVFQELAIRSLLQAAALLHGVGDALDSKSPHKAAREFLLSLAPPPHWAAEEWDHLAWIVRFHRGAEPKSNKGTFAKLSEEQQKTVRALAGVLRLARALRKSGLDTASGLRAESSADTVTLRIPGWIDTVETAARLAVAKHLLETYLEKTLILTGAVKAKKIITLPPKEMELEEVSLAASD